MLVNSGISSSNRIFNVSNPDPMPAVIDEDWIENFWEKRCAILQLVEEIKFDIEACKGLLTIPQYENSPEELLGYMVTSLLE